MSKKEINEQLNQHSELIDNITNAVNSEEEYEVPHWNRAAAFESDAGYLAKQNQGLTWWSWQNIGSLAIAASVSIVALLSIYVNKNDNLDQQSIAKLVKEQVALQLDEEVNLKLREFASEQQVILANYKAELSERQEKNNLQLAGYVLSATRTERKEDMSDFVSFINAQRKDEQLEQKIRFHQLEEAIGFRKANYLSDVINIENQE